jgi:hypothetical protein
MIELDTQREALKQGACYGAMILLLIVVLFAVFWPRRNEK